MENIKKHARNEISLYIAIQLDEFYTFDLMEIHAKKNAVKSILILNFKVKKNFFLYIVFYSSRRWNFSKERNSSIEKWQKSFLII